LHIRQVLDELKGGLTATGDADPAPATLSASFLAGMSESDVTRLLQSLKAVIRKTVSVGDVLADAKTLEEGFITSLESQVRVAEWR